jgi:beta-lactamase superfamily II metal-dependent hydrolase
MLAASALVAGTPAARAARTLDAYFIDVEGGQSTLIVTPEGQSLLVDAGFPGAGGGFASKAGDPNAARDARRVAAAAHQAGVSRIDFLLVTHFHTDHVGGVPELAQLIPIGTFIDHDTVLPAAETTVKGTLAAFDAYAAVRAHGKHLVPKPGDKLPLKGVDAVVVSAAGEVLHQPLPGAGARNPACDDASPVKPSEPNENPRSTGFVLQYGKFRFLDLGDLVAAPLFALVCPANLIGPVDVYLVAHHGNADAAVPAAFAAFRPRVAIMNNGRIKGGAPELFAALEKSPGLQQVWQLHSSDAAGLANAPDEQIANLDERTSFPLVMHAHDDGSFEITNPRAPATIKYPRK